MWPTPSANNYEHANQSVLQARRDRLKAKHINGNGFGLTLGNAAQLASWATPTTRDHKDGSSEGTVPINSLLGRQVWLSGSSAQTEKRGQLNPALSRWLMGYPPAWDDCAGTAMQSYRNKRKSSSKPIRL
jgi:ribosome modulation factor